MCNCMLYFFRRLRENSFSCDCHLSWLARWLKPRKRLAKYVTCSKPANVKGRMFNMLKEADFKCNGKHVFRLISQCCLVPCCGGGGGGA